MLKKKCPARYQKERRLWGRVVMALKLLKMTAVTMCGLNITWVTKNASAVIKFAVL